MSKGATEIAIAGFDVAIDEDLLGAATSWGADQDGVLLALFHARVVGHRQK